MLTDKQIRQVKLNNRIDMARNIIMAILGGWVWISLVIAWCEAI